VRFSDSILSGQSSFVISQNRHSFSLGTRFGSSILPNRFPKAFPDIIRDLELRGEVVYSDGTQVPIPLDHLTKELEDRFVDLMNRFGSIDEPKRVPSENECRFCDITKEDCPDRIESEKRTVPTKLF